MNKAVDVVKLVADSLKVTIPAGYPQSKYMSQKGIALILVS